MTVRMTIVDEIIQNKPQNRIQNALKVLNIDFKQYYYWIPIFNYSYWYAYIHHDYNSNEYEIGLCQRYKNKTNEVKEILEKNFPDMNFNVLLSDLQYFKMTSSEFWNS